MKLPLAPQTATPERAYNYERQADGLGLDFILTVQHTYERLLAFPASGSPFGRRLRRVLVPKFPYGLLYLVEPEPTRLARCSIATTSSALPTSKTLRAS